MKVILLSEIGGVDTKALQKVVAKNVIFILTFYGTPIAFLAPFPFTDKIRIRCEMLDVETAPKIRSAKTAVKDAMWRGEMLGIRTTRRKEIVAVLVPLDLIH